MDNTSRLPFAPHKEQLTPVQALVEAQRCLFCFDAPCTKACPTSIDVPLFIRQLATEDRRGAAETILSENILGGSCGRSCPTEVLCEGACVLNKMGAEPIEIGRLQSFATDLALEQGIRFWPRGESSGRRVAIVGSGPAGLACAHELTRLGHDCMIFEASAQPGGLVTYGVAGYKVDTEFALAEAEYIRQIGITLELNHRIEADELKTLMTDYDAVFLAVGLGLSRELAVPGEELPGCCDALDFIRPTREPNTEPLPCSKVLVIGGGNTAIDAAVAAAKLGAQSTIVYRRTEAEMPAYRHEYELALAHGVQFRWLTAPLRIVERDGRAAGLECARTVLEEVEGGRRQVRIVADSTHVLECDTVVKALGQQAHSELLAKLAGLDAPRGCVAVDSQSGATSVEGLFAGGDCVNGGAEVVNAVEHGKCAARGIHSYLQQQR